MTIGERIRELRESKGMKQKYLAEKAGIPLDTLCKIEKNNRDVRARYIPLIAEVLNVPKSEYYIFFE